jgi:1-acyl-sn-glycerol-3-phosphate acyltransferase
VLAPLVLLLTAAALVGLPVLILVALATSIPAKRRGRGLRVLGLAVAWLLLECAALVASLALWLASGFGGRLRSDSFQDRHYALVRWFLSGLYAVATRAFGLRVEIDEPEATPGELSRRLTRPVVVLSRHAGPGDSFLLVYQLLALYHRRPRIVMKAALQFDPSLDVVINRLPHAFVHPRKAGEGLVVAEIRRLSAGLGPTDALVIFPEGGNFTPRRRVRAIERLRRASKFTEADRAERMEHLLAPRTGGATAAIEACPEADVIFVAHTGLDHLITIGDVWRDLPVNQVIRARWWRVPAPDVPRAREQQVTWLYDWWERIDTWIGAARTVR